VAVRGGNEGKCILAAWVVLAKISAVIDGRLASESRRTSVCDAAAFEFLTQTAGEGDSDVFFRERSAESLHRDRLPRGLRLRSRSNASERKRGGVS